tara:strand:- start:374 stop:649 length:276 start_codon:yes stop_codon:yes gene_type:complete
MRVIKIICGGLIFFSFLQGADSLSVKSAKKDSISYVKKNKKKSLVSFKRVFGVSEIPAPSLKKEETKASKDKCCSKSLKSSRKKIKTKRGS